MQSPRPLPPVIAALQFPPFRGGTRHSMAWYEDFLLQNAAVFVEGGIKAIKIQDETRETGMATQQTVARMAALGRLFRKTYPDIALGIIVQAHDAISPLAIADAADADFVRLKVFVGASLNAEGLREALSVAATDFRAAIARSDIRILADVHDRTSHPLVPVANEMAALWAQNMGADGLVLTGASFADSLNRVETAKTAGVRRPIFIGGGIDAGNIGAALSVADGVVVSSSLLLKSVDPKSLTLWDRLAVEQLMAAVSARNPARSL